ncbi:adenylyl-sulfate kinase [Chitinophaga sp. S165]|uniref:adenylyl-sulfate kinase n=1 Tax=Chitinophaga sp. S165 TaxID=2135462 RepID=UPI000D70B384|nr:adenylyl-sulfate kinase [Chitinophaga sp. S165]PWV45367.1 adenylylsulfate kinase [Chitinophaga sp. S165]
MGHIIQLTGLSGAGKTTLSNALLEWGNQQQIKIKLIDGDVYRQTLCKDLGFSKADRLENIARLGAYAASIAADYDYVFIAAINPYEEARHALNAKYGAALIWLKCDIQALIARDPKGLYRKALLPDTHPDKIHNLTGLNDTFEEPQYPDLVLDTGSLDVEESVSKTVSFLCQLSSLRISGSASKSSAE